MFPCSRAFLCLPFLGIASCSLLFDGDAGDAGSPTSDDAIAFDGPVSCSGTFSFEDEAVPGNWERLGSDGGSCVRHTDMPACGSASLRCALEDIGAAPIAYRIPLNATYSRVQITGQVYFERLPSQSLSFLTFVADTKPIGAFFANADTTVGIYSMAASMEANSSEQVSIGSWHSFQALLSTGLPGSARLIVNDVLLAEFSGDLGTEGVNGVDIGVVDARPSMQPAIVHVDEISIEIMPGADF